MKYLSALLALMVFPALSAQAYWKSIDEKQLKSIDNNEREIIPESFATYELDMKSWVKLLVKAPHEDEKSRSPLKAGLPMPDGSIRFFYFVESPCFSPVLSSKYPAIKSFRGYSEDGSRARIDFGSQGFRGAIETPQGTVYIDPYFKSADKHYISYYVRDHKVDSDGFAAACGLSAYELARLDAENAERDKWYGDTYKTAGEPVIKNTYRLALACTGAWGQLYGTVENVLSRMNTGVNRLNLIFENEIAVKFELIDNNDELVFLDASNDPYSEANMGRVVLGENTAVLNNVVGSDAYDIGHVFTVRCVDGIAGVAFAGSVCQPNKGAGVSCVGTTNVSFFMVQTTAHEIGHQFSGGHTWNNCPSAQDQFSPGTAWEPGSGTTILSYAGVCGAENNVLGTNDDYFHVGSLGQFINFISSLNNCGIQEVTDNHTPDIQMDYDNGFYIPIETPFELDAIATDMDGDDLTYNWEQMNTGPNSTLGDPLGNAPSFRSFPPSPNSKRIFPRLSTILSGNDSDAEVLPTKSRELDFRFTVRDNHEGAGYTVWEDVSFRATGNAGPFTVSYPDQVLFKEIGDTLTVKWDVANTDQAPVNCKDVDIFLSTDGGQNFDIILKSKTPNDGSETVVVPNVISNNAKIKVKAHDNIFFNIGRPDLFIEEPSSPAFFIDVDKNSFEFCLPETVEIEIQGTAFQGFGNDVFLEVSSGLPPEAIVSFSQNPIAPDGTSIMTIDMTGVEYTSVYDVVIKGIAEEADTVTQIISLSATGTSFSDFSALSPASGTEGLGGTPLFSWTASPNATEYTLEVSTNPAFGVSSIIQLEGLTDLSVTPQTALENSTLYYWRVGASNKCTETEYSPIRTFGTVALSCQTFEASDLPKNISATGLPTVRSTIEVFSEGLLSDVNVKNIKGIHQRVGDIKATLISPDLTEVILFENRCFSSNFNVGFDNDSPIDFNCSLNNGIVMKPEKGDLGVFNGKDLKGSWTLQIEDNVPGEGGQFQNFRLELCAGSSLNPPELVHNDTLFVPIGLSAKLDEGNLLSTDPDNTSEELIYTIIALPHSGILLLEGVELSIGSQFSQADINSGLVRYLDTSNSDHEDSFTFTVVDGEGGWIDLTRFEIFVNADVISNVNDDIEEARINIYPNPANDILNVIQSRSHRTDWQYQVVDMSGRHLRSGNIRDSGIISLKNLKAGLYVLVLRNEEDTVIKRFSVTR